MSADEIFIDRIKYISARDAAKKVGLSHNYISKLCRRGLEGTKLVEGVWHVNERALRDFLEKKDRNRQRQLEQLANTRRDELVKSGNTPSPSKKEYDEIKKVVSETLAITEAHKMQRSPLPERRDKVDFGFRKIIATVASSLAVLILLISSAVAFQALSPSGRAERAAFQKYYGNKNEQLAAITSIPLIDKFASKVFFTLCPYIYGCPKVPTTVIVEKKTPATAPKPVQAQAPAQSSDLYASLALLIQNSIEKSFNRFASTYNFSSVASLPPGLVTESTLLTRLSALDQKLTGQINAVSLATSNNATIINNTYETLGAVARIDNLSDIHVTDSHWTGGFITDATITGGSVTATAFNGVLPIANGGTATSAAPTYGQLLIGDGVGGYSLVATSSLGIGAGTGTPGGADGTVQFNSGSTFAGNSSFLFNSTTNLLSFASASTSIASIFDRLYVGGTATTTILGSATSTFGAGVQTTALNITSTSATSTFANGIRLSGGCFQLADGTCAGTGSGSGLTAYDAFTHPIAGQSATTSLLLFSGNASSTQFSAYTAYFGATATSSFSSTGALTLASALTIGNGGTGSTTAPVGQLLYGGASAYQSVATSSPVAGTAISLSGSGALVGSALTINFAAPLGTGLAIPFASTTMITATTASSTNLFISGINSGSLLKTTTGGQVAAAVTGVDYLASYDPFTHPAAGQSATTSLVLFTGGASSTLFSNTGIAYFGGTATSSFSSAGVLTLTNLNGPLQANAGIVSATTSILAQYGGTGQTSYTAGDLLYASNGTTLAKLAIGGEGTFLKVTGGAPTWGAGAGGGGGTDVNWTFANGGIYPSTTTNQVIIGGTATSSWLNPLAKLGVTGGASFDAASTTNALFAASILTSGAKFGATATSSFASDGSLTLASALTIGNGGTGSTTAPIGQLLYGGASAYQSVSTTSVACAGTAACTGFTAIGSTPITITGSGITAYDAWTHPIAGQSATTSLLVLNGNASSTLFSILDTLYVGRTATTTIRGDGLASTIPFASTTMITTTSASTTNFTISSINSGSLLKTTTAGAVTAAIAGTDYATAAMTFGKAWEVSGGFLAPTTTLYVTNIQQASSTLFSALTAKFGSTASSSFAADGSLTLAAALTIGNGGTGSTTAPVGQILYGGASAYQSVATSSVSAGTALSFTGTPGALVGGSALTINFAAPAGTGLSIPFASTTMVSATTASSTNLWISGIASGSLLKTTTGGQVTAATAGSDFLSSYDPFTHPAAGQSATTSLLLLNGAASSTLFSNTGTAYFGGTATSSFSATGALTLATALTISNGGTGTTTAPSSQLLYGGGGGVYQSVATSSPVAGTAISLSGSGALVGSALTINFAAPAGTGLSIPFASTTMISATTASSTNLIVSSAGGTGTRCLQVGADGTVSANASACATSGITTYDAFTHPAAGQSATTSTMFFTGGASTTLLSIVDRLYVGGTATTTIFGSATSTFGAGLQTTALDVTSNSASSTFANGIQLSAGCFRGASGTCITNTDTSSFVTGNGSGANTRVAYWTSSSNLTSSANLTFDGTTLTANDLLISKTGTAILSINDTGSTGTDFRIDVASGVTTFQADVGAALTGEYFAFNTNNDEKMRLTEGGRLGIGTTSPWAALSVNPTALGSSVPEFVVGSSTMTHFLVDGSGNTAIGTTSPFALLSLQATSTLTKLNLFAIGSTTAAGVTSTLFKIDNTGIASTTGLVVSNTGGTGTRCLQVGADGTVSANASACGTGSGGDSFTHPAAGQSATTSTMLFSNGATSTSIGAFSAAFGATATTTFTADGKVGIGTTTPFAALQVGTTTGKNLVLTDLNAGNDLKHWLLSVLGGNFVLSTTTDAYATSTAPAFQITKAGLVGIGTSTPGSILAVQGAANFNSTATSTIYNGLATPLLNLTSSTASSTFANGVNLTAGCFSQNGVCVIPGGGGGVLLGTFSTSTVGTNVQVVFTGAAGSQPSFSAGVLTLPSNTSYVETEVWGGGGGGSGGGNAMGNGGDGGSSCFGTNSTACTSPLLSASNGSGGVGGSNGGAGGSGSGGDINMTGSGSGGITDTSASLSYFSGFPGGSAPRGGGGGAANRAAAGSNGSAFGGGGGGGALEGGNSVAFQGGSGGGGGGYSQKRISPLSGTYYYTVGAGGSAGTAGTSGYAGGTGGAGGFVIRVYTSISANGTSGGQLLGIYSTSTVGTNVTVNLNGTAGSAPSFSGGVLTLPSNTSHMVIQTWGAGGGGGGTVTATDGGTGGSTCFGTNSTACTSPALSATGGSGGKAGAGSNDGVSGGAGGAGSSGDVNITGGGGDGGQPGVGSSFNGSGGAGGNAPAGGGGGKGIISGGIAGSAFGGGGSGGGGGGGGGVGGGGGGGGGGYSEKLITSPSGTYYYTVGSSGTAGTGGNSGGAGGAGGLVIEVYATGLTSGTNGSGTTGQVAYYASSGTNQTATSSLFIDTSSNIGIGSTTPWGTLSITNVGTNPSLVVEDAASPDASLFIIDATGMTGIGTSTPWGQLSVNPNALGSGVPEFVIGSSTRTHFLVDGSGNVGIGTTSPFALLSLQATSTLTKLNLFSIGSTTAAGVTRTLFNIDNTGVASTTGLVISNTGGTGTRCLQVGADGTVSANAAACGTGSGGDSFTHPAAGFSATTSTMVFNSSVGVGGTTTPYALLSVVATSTNGTGAPVTLFAIASTTAGTATSTLLVVKNDGNVGIGTSTPYALLSIQATSTINTRTLLSVASTSAAGVVTTLFNIANDGVITSSALATSTFAAGIQATNLNLTSTTATSTAANGINLSGGCFSINGTCTVGSGGGVLLGVFSTSTVGTNVQVVFTGAAGSQPSFSAGVLTLPSNTSYMETEVWGGGGGGRGGGDGGNGGSGGQSCFSNSSTSTACSGVSGPLLSATGGGGGALTPPAGGTGSSGDLNLTGEAPTSGSGAFTPAGGANNGGTAGGSAPRGGGGGAGGYYAGAGTAGSPFGGGGGGGGMNGDTVSHISGTGGAGGGYSGKLITSPSGSYYYTIGSGGTAGTAGTNGLAGAAGGAGGFVVRVYTTISANGTSGGQLLGIYSTSTPGTNVTVNLNGVAGSAPSFSGGVLTLPSNASTMIAHTWGAGGGGGGGGFGSTGGTGGTSSFGNGTGSGLATTSATGGAGGASTGVSAGGAGSGGDVNLTGGGASAGGSSNASTNYYAGTTGGAAPRGGEGGTGDTGTNGNAGKSFGGGGGGGGVGASNSTAPAGTGGGGGGYAQKLITSPSGTYYYNVGASGAGGAAGATCGGGTCYAGGAGGAGGLVIEVYATGLTSGSAGTGTAGQVSFYSTAGNQLTATSSIFVNTTNSFVGIGSTSPTSMLSVGGDVNIAAGSCYRVNGVCIGYTVKLSRIYATTTTGTYVTPANLSHAVIECVGGGGGGGGASGSVAAGAGGGAGSYSRTYATSTRIGTTQTVTIGAGGAAGTSGGGNGGAGGDTSFGSLCVGKAGSGGAGSATASNITAPGAGGVAGTGDVTATGAPGGAGQSLNNTTYPVPGHGGSSPFGGGGVPDGTVNATGYGAGGAGAWTLGSSVAGGTGSAGLVVITEYSTSTPNAAGNDYAEMFPVSNPMINAADIVAVDVGVPVSMKLAKKGDTLAGVIATAPGQVLGDINALGQRPVALAGRVPVKFSLENGPVKLGDRIAPSSIPGVGMKAGYFDDSIGIVIGDVEDGKVMVFLDLQQGLDINQIAMGLVNLPANTAGAGGAGQGFDFIGGLMQKISQRMAQSAQTLQTASALNALKSLSLANEITYSANAPEADASSKGLTFSEPQQSQDTAKFLDYFSAVPYLVGAVTELDAKMESIIPANTLSTTDSSTTATSTPSFADRFWNTLYDRVADKFAIELVATSSPRANVVRFADLDSATSSLYAQIQSDIATATSSLDLLGYAKTEDVSLLRQAFENNLGATATAQDLLAATSSDATTTPLAASSSPWFGSFANASQPLKDALASLSDTVIHVFGNAIYAVTGIFDRVLAKEITAQNIYADSVHSKELCLEDVCITKKELQDLLERHLGAVLSATSTQALFNTIAGNATSHLVDDTAVATTNDTATSSTLVIGDQPATTVAHEVLSPDVKTNHATTTPITIPAQEPSTSSTPETPPSPVPAPSADSPTPDAPTPESSTTTSTTQSE